MATSGQCDAEVQDGDAESAAAMSTFSFSGM
jgi:hypothetical protein